MIEKSIFLDESGEQGTESKYYLLTMVFHDQSLDISKQIDKYEQALRDCGLPDVPLHTSPLMHGHDAYANMSLTDRKRLLMSFFIMLQHMPITYFCLRYRKGDFADSSRLRLRMQRDILDVLIAHLSDFQQCDVIKVYYDSGQAIVSNAVHAAVEFAFSKEAVLYKKSNPQEYRLEQAADLICTLELLDLKYSSREESSTDTAFFGSSGNFRKNYLKKIRRMRLSK